MADTLNVAVIGGDTAGIRLLKLLHASEHEVTLVMCRRDSDELRPASMWKTASELAMPTVDAAGIRSPELPERLRDNGVDLILSVRSPYIVPQAVLDCARIGAFNMHHGPLPEYAGLNVASWALYHGEATHGVTVHWMDAGVDTGRVAYEARFPIAPRDTALSLLGKCMRHGLPLVMRVVETAAVDPSGIPRAEQDLTRRRYFGRKAPDDGWLNFSRTAAEVRNFVRACDYFPAQSPWGTPRATLRGKEVGVRVAELTGDASTDASPGELAKGPAGAAWVACADEWLELRELLVDGARTRGADFVAAVKTPKPGVALRTGA